MNDREPHRAEHDIIAGFYHKLTRELLTLRPEHAAALRARGLGDEWIKAQGYCSTPQTQAERDRVIEVLAEYLDAFGGGVPGFYHDGRRWQMVFCAPGYFIPARDELCFIQALAYRLDHPRGGMKYVWFSSNPEAEDDCGRQKYPRGASSGAPFHFANRAALWEAEEVTVTEGTLKADCIAALSGLPVVGVAGVNNTRGLAGRLRRNFLHLWRINVAFDRDVLDKPHVADALERLITQLEGERFTVRVRTWRGEAKGLDDYLLSQLRAGEVTAV
jgi:uncharacterized protein DUF3854